MAVFVLTDASLTVNSIALSAYVTQITLNYERDTVETTSMGASSHLFTGGLYNVSLDVSLNQDFAASTVAATLDGLIGTPTTVVIKPTSAAVGATNPTYTIANTVLTATQPVNGATGDLAAMSVTFQGGTLTKATS